MTFELAVLGDPVAHSLSPQIHREFARQAGLDVRYQKIQVAADEFQDVVKHFFASGGKGLNVTVPHKQRAFSMAVDLSNEAQLAGSVNTLFVSPSGDLRGETTDGSGLVTDLTENLGWNLQGSRILLLGAGGAAQGVVADLLKSHPESLVIANRTLEKAQGIVTSQGSPLVSAIPLSKLSDEESFDIIISASSAGLNDSAHESSGPLLPPQLSHQATCCYDMVYGKQTNFLTWAAHLPESQRADGLGMLVEQAAKSFALWFDVKIDSTPVLSDLRASIAAQTNLK